MGIQIGQEVFEESQKLINKKYPPASLPGQPPRKRTGKLQKSGRMIPTAHGCRLVYFAPYSKFLELGTRRMAARPFISRAYDLVMKRRKRAKGKRK